jgi:RNA polymerase sigma-70 factor, ECF subfamily
MGKNRAPAGDEPLRLGGTLHLIEAEIPHLRRYARYIRRELDQADDLVQECLARAIAKIHTWQPGTNLRAWLFVILRNCHIDEIRRSRQMDTVDDSVADEPSLTTPANQETRLVLSEVRDAFLALREEHREVLLLVVIEGLPYEEAAAILGTPVGTVRSRLSRARQALRQAFESGDETPTSPPANRTPGVQHGGSRVGPPCDFDPRSRRGNESRPVVTFTDHPSEVVRRRPRSPMRRRVWPENREDSRRFRPRRIV